MHIPNLEAAHDDASLHLNESSETIQQLFAEMMMMIHVHQSFLKERLRLAAGGDNAVHADDSLLVFRSLLLLLLLVHWNGMTRSRR